MADKTKKSKKTDGIEVAEKLLEKQTAKNDIKFVSLKVKGTVNMLRSYYGYGDKIVILTPPRSVFPPNKTDQLHGATIADLVSQGQGHVEETELSNFDYPVKIVDGKPVETPDRGEKAHGPRSLEWADPAERYESELAVHNEIVTGIRREAAEKAAALARQRAIDSAEKKSTAEKGSSVTPQNEVQGK